MANPELSRHIQALPDELNALEGGREISERLRRVDALKDRARSLEPLDGVEDMALADYDRDLFCFNVCSTGSAVFFRSVG